MIAAFRRAGSFRGEAAVTTWLHRVVVNACLDRLRAAKIRRFESMPDDVEDRGTVVATAVHDDQPEAVAEDVEQRRRVLDALATLPAEQRAALVLVDMEGYPVAEVAEMLGCAEGTVKSRCSRGRTKLAALLADLRHPAGDPPHGNPPPTVPSNPPCGHAVLPRPEQPPPAPVAPHESPQRDTRGGDRRCPSPPDSRPSRRPYAACSRTPVTTGRRLPTSSPASTRPSPPSWPSACPSAPPAPRDRARRPLAGTRRRPRLPPTPGGEHRPAGRRLRRRRGRRARPGPPPRRQRRRRSRVPARSPTPRSPSPPRPGGPAPTRAPAPVLTRAGLRRRLRARAGVAEELSRHPLRRRCRACRRRTPTSTTSSSPCGRTAPPSPAARDARRAPGLRRPPSGQGRRPRRPRRSTAEPGLVVFRRPRRRGAGRRALRVRRGRSGAYDHAARALSRCGRGLWNNGRLRSVEDDVPAPARSAASRSD